MVHRLRRAVGVGCADDVDVGVADRAGDGDHRDRRGELAQLRGCGLGAEQQQRLAAVSEQVCHGCAFVPVGGDGAEREFVARGGGRPIQPGDEVTMEGVLDPEDHAEKRLFPRRSSWARVSGR